MLSKSGKSEVSSEKIYSLSCKKIPRSGNSQELLDYEEISARAIVNKVLELKDKIFYSW
jgi:transketolase